MASALAATCAFECFTSSPSSAEQAACDGFLEWEHRGWDGCDDFFPASVCCAAACSAVCAAACPAVCAAVCSAACAGSWTVSPEKAREIQVTAQVSGAPLILPSEQVCEYTARQLTGDAASDFEDHDAYDLAWGALLRLVERIAPGFKD